MSPPTDRPAQAANSACRAPAYSSRLRRPSERLPEPVSGAEQEALAVGLDEPRTCSPTIEMPPKIASSVTDDRRDQLPTT